MDLLTVRDFFNIAEENLHSKDLKVREIASALYLCATRYQSVLNEQIQIEKRRLEFDDDCG